MGGGCEQAYAAFLEKWGEFMNTDVTEAELNAIKYSGNMNKADMEANGYTKWKWGYKAPRQLMFDKAIMGEYFHIYRSFWRSHMCAVDGTPRLLVCPDECDQAFTPFEECTCEVSALLNGKTTWQNLFPCVLSTTENQNDFLAIMPEDLVVDMMTMLATSSVVEGDMIESSSPQDPLFWMIHTVIERMLSAKVPSLPLLDPCNHRRNGPSPPPLHTPRLRAWSAPAHGHHDGHEGGVQVGEHGRRERALGGVLLLRLGPQRDPHAPRALHLCGARGRGRSAAAACPGTDNPLSILI
jgi:hypothetical protein